MSARDYVDANTGDEFVQPYPWGPLTQTSCADGQPPTGQKARTWEMLTASGRELRPKP